MSRSRRIGFISATGLSALAVILLALSAYRTAHLKFVMGNTSSMSPTIKSGELVYARPLERSRGELRRYQIVVFRSPMPPYDKWAMRIAGLPGECLHITTNALLINGTTVAEGELPVPLRGSKWLTPQLAVMSSRFKWTLGPGEIFVVGDNLPVANDSRFWGPLDLSNVLGVVERTAKGKALEVRLDPAVPVRAKIIVRDGQKQRVDPVNHTGNEPDLRGP
jgi:signal peptidase I